MSLTAAAGSRRAGSVPWAVLTKSSICAQYWLRRAIAGSLRSPPFAAMISVEPNCHGKWDDPQLVTGHIRAQASELDALADGPAGVLADPAEQFGRDERGPR